MIRADKKPSVRDDRLGTPERFEFVLRRRVDTCEVERAGGQRAFVSPGRVRPTSEGGRASLNAHNVRVDIGFANTVCCGVSRVFLAGCGVRIHTDFSHLPLSTLLYSLLPT